MPGNPLQRMPHVYEVRRAGRCASNYAAASHSAGALQCAHRAVCPATLSRLCPGITLYRMTIRISRDPTAPHSECLPCTAQTHATPYAPSHVSSIMAITSLLIWLCASMASGQIASAAGSLLTIAEVVHGRAEHVVYHGRPAITLIPASDTSRRDGAVLAIVDGPAFTDRTIQLSVVGVPRAGAPPDSRGFVGLSFRTGPHGEWSEVFYLRPLNARADNQLRRNHTVQYVSEPEFPWDRLRKESPGLYESYADMEAGEWTTMRIEVSGSTARLYVNGAVQPCLVVTDLKRGAGSGRVALWAHVETEAYFGPLSVTAR